MTDLPTLGPPPPRASPPPHSQPGRRRPLRLPTVLVLTVALALVAGYTIGQRKTSVAQQSAVVTQPSKQPSTTTDVASRPIAAQLDDSIINITSRLSSGDMAAGTGIIISSNGLALTNNHVIADSAQLRTENSATGSIHSATVLGYSLTADVAVIQIQGVSGLKPAPIGAATNLAVGDAVVGLGNAGGNGGAPSIASGHVTALNQPIVASDNAGSTESLTGLIEMDAGIQPGDSGGPLADAAGRVVGIDVAASTPDPRFSFSSRGNHAYAIPIQTALDVAHRITTGAGGPGIHIGATRGVLGVGVTDAGQVAAGSGAPVTQVAEGSPAASAGISAGAFITSIDGTTVRSASDLTRVMTPYSAHDRVRVNWTDSSGTDQHATITLESAPPA